MGKQIYGLYLPVTRRSSTAVTLSFQSSSDTSKLVWLKDLGKTKGQFGSFPRGSMYGICFTKYDKNQPSTIHVGILFPGHNDKGLILLAWLTTFFKKLE